MCLPGEVRGLALVAVGIIGIGVLLHIIGLATTEWSSLHDNGASVKAGLWKVCIKLLQEEHCDKYIFDKGGDAGDEFANTIRACRAFAILGMLAGIMGLVMAAVSVGKPNNPRLSAISMAGCLAAFIFIVITISVWAAVVHAKYLSILNLGYSFYLSIAGSILIAVGGVLARLGNK